MDFVEQLELERQLPPAIEPHLEFLMIGVWSRSKYQKNCKYLIMLRVGDLEIVALNQSNDIRSIPTYW